MTPPTNPSNRDEIVRLGALLDRWQDCAARLHTFAIAYRSHPQRNPNDRLNEALNLYDELSRESSTPSPASHS